MARTDLLKEYDVTRFEMKNAIPRRTNWTIPVSITVRKELERMYQNNYY